MRDFLSRRMVEVNGYMPVAYVGCGQERNPTTMSFIHDCLDIKKATIHHVSDYKPDYYEDAEIEATAEGLEIHGATIPWAWIDTARGAVK